MKKYILWTIMWLGLSLLTYGSAFWYEEDDTMMTPDWITVYSNKNKTSVMDEFNFIISWNKEEFQKASKVTQNNVRNWIHTVWYNQFLKNLINSSSDMPFWKRTYYKMVNSWLFNYQHYIYYNMIMGWFTLLYMDYFWPDMVMNTSWPFIIAQLKDRNVLIASILWIILMATFYIWLLIKRERYIDLIKIFKIIISWKKENYSSISITDYAYVIIYTILTIFLIWVISNLSNYYYWTIIWSALSAIIVWLLSIMIQFFMIWKVIDRFILVMWEFLDWKGNLIWMLITPLFIWFSMIFMTISLNHTLLSNLQWSYIMLDPNLINTNYSVDSWTFTSMIITWKMQFSSDSNWWMALCISILVLFFLWIYRYINWTALYSEQQFYGQFWPVFWSRTSEFYKRYKEMCKEWSNIGASDTIWREYKKMRSGI